MLLKISVTIILITNLQLSTECPQHRRIAKDTEGDSEDQNSMVTLEKVKSKLLETGIFDWRDPTLTPRETKELNLLFDTVETMITTRNRQPSSVQNVFGSIRALERAVKKQLKEGHISQKLADRFKWDKLVSRQKPRFYIDKTTNMRIYDVNDDDY